MNRPLDNQHVIEIKALPSPRAIKTKLPITDQAAALVVETREAIRRILHGDFWLSSAPAPSMILTPRMNTPTS